MERDLLVQTGFTLDDVGGALSWSALGAFLHQVEPDGAIAQEIEPDIAAFSSRLKTNDILADIYDILAQINANMVAGFSRKQAHKPRRYPRPGDNSKRHIGKNNSMTVNELDSWFAEKRKQKKQKHGGEQSG